MKKNSKWQKKMISDVWNMPNSNSFNFQALWQWWVAIKGIETVNFTKINHSSLSICDFYQKNSFWVHFPAKVNPNSSTQLEPIWDWLSTVELFRQGSDAYWKSRWASDVERSCLFHSFRKVLYRSFVC